MLPPCVHAHAKPRGKAPWRSFPFRRSAARFARDFGAAPEAVWPRAVERMVRGGLMERQGERLRLTPRGMQVMNGVLVELLREQGGE